MPLSCIHSFMHSCILHSTVKRTPTDRPKGCPSTQKGSILYIGVNPLYRGQSSI